MRIHEDSQDFRRGFTRLLESICKALGDFGRGFMRIHKTLGEDLQGFARLWEMICEDSW